MLAKTLQLMIDQDLTTAKEIGELTGKAPSTVYRWINGKSEPDFNSIRLLLRHLPSRKGQRAILASFTAGTQWHSMPTDQDLDQNHDGKVDTEDALDCSIQTVQLTADLLERVRDACKSRSISPEEAVKVVQLLEEVIEQSHIARQVVVKECERFKRSRLKLAK